MRSRRTDYSESTRQALVDSALELFTKKGYANTSLDVVAKRARVTKGALYHHFSGKVALFEAVFDTVERGVIERLSKIVDGPGSAWDRAMDGLQTYIKVCQEPSYQRIVIHEGPVVMGRERWGEAEEHYSYGVVRATIESLVQTGEMPDLSIEVTARMMFGALTAGATIIAAAEDQRKAGAEVAAVVTELLKGMRRGGRAPQPALQDEAEPGPKLLRRARLL